MHERCRTMEAIILAGGKGTRLQSIINKVPKPMAPIKGKPFLYYVLINLTKFNIKKIILATGYMHDEIEAYFGYEFEGIPIVYSKEIEPLGTGGAIKLASSFASSENVLVVNGDTYFAINLDKLMANHLEYGADVTIALKMMDNSERYGRVILSDGRITGFLEKSDSIIKQGCYINGGIYLINKRVMELVSDKLSFSFEIDFLEKYIYQMKVYGVDFKDYFIDIGIPEDYQKAMKEL